MKKQIKKMIRDLQERIIIVKHYIKNQLENLTFYNELGYQQQQEKTIRNLDLSWEQIDMYKSQLRELKRDYKGSK
jgi:hypothetical protein